MTLFMQQVTVIIFGGLAISLSLFATYIAYKLTLDKIKKR